VLIFDEDEFSIASIAYGNGTFVATGNGSNSKMATSTNGTTWTVVDVSSIFDDFSFLSVAYGNGTFVAVGSDGDQENGKMATSLDGTTWTAVDVSSIFVGTDYIWSIAYGDGKFVAGSNRGKMAIGTFE